MVLYGIIAFLVTCELYKAWDDFSFWERIGLSLLMGLVWPMLFARIVVEYFEGDTPR